MAKDNQHKILDEEISRTMGLLSKMERAEPHEGLYNRVIHRMQSRNQEASNGWLVLWPRFSYMVAGLIIILLLNVFSIGYYLQTSRVEQDQLDLNVYVEEFTQSMPSLYEYEPNEDE